MDVVYQEICDVVLHLKDHRDVVVRKAVMVLLPSLAASSPNTFVASYLHQTMMYLMAQLKKDKDRAAGMAWMNSTNNLTPP